jgi:hypothetical protein
MKTIASLLLGTLLIGLGHSVYAQSSTAQSSASYSSTPVPFSAQMAAGAPNNPKVEVAWNRYYDYKAYTSILQNLQKAYPELSDLQSIGKSHEGKHLWVMTITNKKTGVPSSKPGMYIAANIHANEIQATEVTLYTAWYLLENYERNAWIKQLVDTRTFYIIPTQSPDSRDKYMYEANSANTPRTGQVPRDDDGDGLINEDRTNDLNGDGHITMMRKKVGMGLGTWKVSAEDTRIMVRCNPDEACDYEMLGQEGFDMDGDGRVNEDGDGSYDPNRNWGWNWQPNYIQGGADRYPFNLPETKAVADFVKSHSNIIGGQSYHNTGGMILRGPGAREDRVEPADERIFDVIGAIGEQQLPGYRYLITWRDLYTVYGGETDWLYAGEGIMPFVNELWTPFNMFRQSPTPSGGGGGGGGGGNTALAKFDRLLLFGDAYVPWQEVEHPTFGKVEVGGTKKYVGRMPPSFLLEEECHRNMAFTLHHAWHLPQVRVHSIASKSLGNGLTEVVATLVNERSVPSRLAVDVKNNITRPDWVTLKGGKVISGGIRPNRFEDTFVDQPGNRERVEVSVVPGMGNVQVVWIVQGNGPFEVSYDGVKSGKHSLKK